MGQLTYQSQTEELSDEPTEPLDENVASREEELAREYRLSLLIARIGLALIAIRFYVLYSIGDDSPGVGIEVFAILFLYFAFCGISFLVLLRCRLRCPKGRGIASWRVLFMPIMFAASSIVVLLLPLTIEWVRHILGFN